MRHRQEPAAGVALPGLHVKRLTVNVGVVPACVEVSLSVLPGEITAVLGANGSGKSMMLAGIAGTIAAHGGAILLDGARIDGLPAYRRAQLGLAYVEQGRGVFARLTVAQNLRLVERSESVFERAFELFPGLARRRDVAAGLLSGGEQQMLVIARALATEPRVLIVDEFSRGLAPRVVAAVMAALRSLAERGMGVLLVEQFAEQALRVSTTVHIMSRGVISRTASSAELLENTRTLRELYQLGDLDRR